MIKGIKRTFRRSRITNLPLARASDCSQLPGEGTPRPNQGGKALQAVDNGLVTRRIKNVDTVGEEALAVLKGQIVSTEAVVQTLGHLHLLVNVVPP